MVVVMYKERSNALVVRDTKQGVIDQLKYDLFQETKICSQAATLLKGETLETKIQ